MRGFIGLQGNPQNLYPACAALTLLGAAGADSGDDTNRLFQLRVNRLRARASKDIHSFLLCNADNVRSTQTDISQSDLSGSIIVYLEYLSSPTGLSPENGLMQ